MHRPDRTAGAKTAGSHGLWSAGAGSLLALSLILPTTAPAEAQADPPPNRITVDVSWPDDHLVWVIYEISDSGASPGLSDDGPYGHGCYSFSGQPEYGDTAPKTLEVNTLANSPGAYQVAAYFGAMCLDYSEAGNEEPDPLGAYEEYPEGTPIEVTAVVRYWEGDRQVGSETLSGTT